MTTPLGADLGRMSTEQVDPRFESIDRMPVAELAALMNAADATVPAAVGLALPRIVVAIEAVTERLRDGGRLIYVGAGTPGRLGVLDASESPPTFGTPPGQVLAIIAGGAEALVSAIEGAEDDAELGAAAIADAQVGPLDAVVGIASSGRTPYVVAAVEEAHRRGALTVGLSCNVDSQLSGVVEHPIEIAVGPELVSGSTRLKAGTAQKLVLNMFSTITMIQLGKTYGNLMVDVRASNAKLRERAIRIVRQVAAADRVTAVSALERTDFRVKHAILLLRLGLDPETAEARLAAAGGRLRSVLEGTA